jgi:hypothetical protein
VLTKITRYKTQGKKRALAISYRRRVKNALLSLSRGVILCNTPEAVDAAAALAQMISRVGMNNNNYLLFLVLLETNNPSVVDVLIGWRNPFILFAPIKPNWYLLKESFRILAKYKGNELSEKALLALLGVIQNAYKTSKYGYKLYPLSMSDIYNIGKYLDKKKDQDNPRNRLLLEILFDIYFVGIDSDDRNMILVGIKANDMRMAFFDNTKKMVDVVPHVLLLTEPAVAPTPTRSFVWQGDDGKRAEKPRAAAVRGGKAAQKRVRGAGTSGMRQKIQGKKSLK